MAIFSKMYLIFLFMITSVNLSRGSDQGKDSSLSIFRNFMLEEVNFLRTRPHEYADKRLKQDQYNATDNGAYEYLRKVKPLNGLKFNEVLNTIALEYAQFLGNNNKFSHSAKGTPFTRAKKAGYSYRAMGENIACGNDPQLNALENPRFAAIEFIKMLVIDKEVKDLGHRQTLLNPIYKSVGIGFGHNPKSYCINYVVQDFGNP